MSPVRALFAAGSVIVMFLGVLVACSEADDDTNPESPPALVISEAAMALPAGANTAVYLTIVNEGMGEDRLIGASTPLSDRVELHETRAGDDGLMRMQRVDAVEIPAGETVRLEPGGLHVMVFDVDEVSEGAEVEVTLVFQRSGDVVVEIPVRSYDELIEGDADQDHDHD